MPGSRPPFQRAFGDAARERRLELGLTQEELANEHDLDQRWISNVECGWRNLQLANIRRLAAALELRPSELLARAERHEASRR
jgi:transcriptional regulator with XRE-family HTH domain